VLLVPPRTDPQAHQDNAKACQNRCGFNPHALRRGQRLLQPGEKKRSCSATFQGSNGDRLQLSVADIVAHETTHCSSIACIAGYSKTTIRHAGVSEAFAGPRCLFQHFTFPRFSSIRSPVSRGDLETQSLLANSPSSLARRRAATARCAPIGELDSDGKWNWVVPNPSRLRDATEPTNGINSRRCHCSPHFWRSTRLRTRHRRAGQCRLGHPAAGCLASGSGGCHRKETTKAAQHFLSMCIRALDYCPLLTLPRRLFARADQADYDMVANDKHGYRVALIESFRRWASFEGLKTLSESSLRWPYAAGV